MARRLYGPGIFRTPNVCPGCKGAEVAEGFDGLCITCWTDKDIERIAIINDYNKKGEKSA